jgi:hypothetical protein
VHAGVLALLALVLLAGCATGAPVGFRVASGDIRHRPGVPTPAPRTAPRQEASRQRLLAAGDTRGWGLLEGETRDDFQVLQEAAGLEESARHARGEALGEEDARELLEALAKKGVTLKGFGPRLTLESLLQETLRGDSEVPYADVLRRLERFRFLVVVRPDGYLTGAIRGKPLQRAGEVRLVDGRLTAGAFEVGVYYFSNYGVLFPVDAQLRKAGRHPLGELSLEKDWLNTALDGAGDALLETALALGQTVAHPIRTLEGLAQLPSAVAALIASSPEYFAHYGTLPLNEQIREAARLSTHLMLLSGGAAGTAARITSTGARLPVLTLSARGALAVETVTVPAGALVTPVGAGAGAVYVFMAQKGRGEGPKAPAPQKEPGTWKRKKPTNRSESATGYQEQISGRPASEVYIIDGVEFDGYANGVLLEAKGPGYSSFFDATGEPQYWYRKSGRFDELMAQAENQSGIARKLGIPLRWHVAEREVAEFLRKLFLKDGFTIEVVFTPVKPRG